MKVDIQYCEASCPTSTDQVCTLFSPLSSILESLILLCCACNGDDRLFLKLRCHLLSGAGKY